MSAITAPFRVAKKTIALKVGAVKAAKAVKIAKISRAANILKNLKKSPIILPVHVGVPVKSFPLQSLPAPNSFNIPPPSLADTLGPIRGFYANAQHIIQTASTFTSNSIFVFFFSFFHFQTKTNPIFVFHNLFCVLASGIPL